jgi:hypothetical protein
MSAFRSMTAGLLGRFGQASTTALPGLLSVAAEQRDEAWRDQFYAAIPGAMLLGFQPAVAIGPDTFPYLQLALPAAGRSGRLTLADVLDRCLQEGCGIALFADARRSEPAAWVFTYGELLSYKLYGRFSSAPAERFFPADGSAFVESDGTRRIFMGAPSESFLPAYARKVIGDFYRATLRHPAPQVVLVFDPQTDARRSLMVNLTLDDYGGDEDKLRAAMYYTRWFLPDDYGLMSMPPGQNMQSFVPLV